MRLTEKILQVLSDGDSYGEWAIASRLYEWNAGTRSKHGAWIRSIVQSLWKLEKHGLVGHFWVSHGDGVAGDRLWFRIKE